MREAIFSISESILVRILYVFLMVSPSLSPLNNLISIQSFQSKFAVLPGKVVLSVSIKSRNNSENDFPDVQNFSNETTEKPLVIVKVRTTLENRKGRLRHV